MCVNSMFNVLIHHVSFALKKKLDVQTDPLIEMRMATGKHESRFYHLRRRAFCYFGFRL